MYKNPLLSKVLSIFSLVMILAYLAIGIFILTSPRFDNMSKAMRTGFAGFVFIYAVFRFIRFYQELKKQQRNKNEI